MSGKALAAGTSNPEEPAASALPLTLAPPAVPYLPPPPKSATLQPPAVTIQTMSYPGGKAGAGTLQRIINRIPPHDVYIEPFAGGAAVYRAKKPAKHSYLLDTSSAALDAIPCDGFRMTKHCGDAIAWLRVYFADKRPPSRNRGPHRFVFVDPPYPASTLRSPCRYDHDLTDQQHAALLDVLDSIPAAVALTTYDTPMYSNRLAHWRKETYTTNTRRGPRQETLYMNYRPPARPHDLRYWGENKREREKLARRKRNMLAKLRRLPYVERLQLLEAIADEFGQASPAGTVAEFIAARAAPDLATVDRRNR